MDEKLLLEAYAIEESENIWRLDGDRTLLAQEAGYDIEMLREFWPRVTSRICRNKSRASFGRWTIARMPWN